MTSIKGEARMNTFSVSEAVKLFQSFGIHDCDEKLVQEWINETSKNNQVTSKQLYRQHFNEFQHWYRVKGTAYEQGLNDKVRIVRLFTEISSLKRKIVVLKREKEDLEDQLSTDTF